MRSSYGTRGFSLIELLLVLGVVALLATAAFAIYRSVSLGNQTRKAALEMSMIASGMEMLKDRSPAPNRNPFYGINGVALLNARLIPSSMMQGPAIRNAFGGGIGVLSTSANSSSCLNGSACRHYTITFTGVPADACAPFVSNISRAFLYIYVQGNSGGRILVQSPTTGLQVEGLASACNIEPSGVRVLAVGK